MPILKTYLYSDVVKNGSVSAAYPSGFTPDSFDKAGAKACIGSAEVSLPADSYSLSWGASAVTVTSLKDTWTAGVSLFVSVPDVVTGQGEEVRSIVDPVTGGVEELTAAGETMLRTNALVPSAAFYRQGNDLASPTIGWTGVTVTPNDGSMVINSSGAVTHDGEPWFEVNATNNSAGTDNYEIAFPILANGLSISGDQASIEFYCDKDQSALSSISLYLGQGAAGSYAVMLNTPARSMPSWGVGVATFNGGHNNLLFTTSHITATPGTSGLTAKGDYAITHGKIRVTLVAGASCVFRLRNVSLGHAPKKGRLAIVMDDGYSSFLKLALPLIQRFGYPTTIAVVNGTVGTGTNALTKATLAELKAFVSQGNECVAHGPNPDGNGTLFSNGAYTHATNATRIADINAARDYLLANNLTTSRGARCYVFPGGEYGATAGDTSLLDLMFSNGYTFARTAQGVDPAVFPQNFRSMSARCHSRLTGGTVGHTYQGTAATPDTDTTNVNTVITRIQRLASEGCDGTLMLHKSVPRGAATSGSGTIEIEIDQLHALLTAIKALTDAGTLECVLLSEYAE